MPRSSWALIESSHPVMRNGDIAYRYRPDSNFYYLTGIKSEPAAALFIKSQYNEESYHLFAQPYDPKRSRWEGERIHTNELVSNYFADEGHNLSVLPEYIRSHCYSLDICFSDRDTVMSDKCHQESLLPLITELRLYKNTEEIKYMKRAASISLNAHKRCMQIGKAGINENALHAEILHTFYSHSGQEAYPSIVAGGERACILHYQENSSAIKDGELVLIDAGAEYEYYSSDITRVFPVNGTFTKAQAEIYQLVLAAQKSAIEKATILHTMNDVHTAAIRVLVSGLIDLGFLKGNVDENLENKNYFKYYMHGTSHWLGLDVHDPGEFLIEGKSRQLERGMAMTIEPGLYLNDEKLPIEYQNIGIRIEDDVAITSKAPILLSKGKYREIDEIEGICNDG